MLCDKCKKNQATVHTVTNINGIKNEKHLCAQCAAQKQAGSGFFGTDWLEDSLFGHNFLKNFFNVQPSTTSNLICKNCGYTLDDFERTGLLGCSDCYSTFEEPMIPVLTRIHGNVEHVGDVPKEAGEEAIKSKEIERLQAEQKEAIAKEDYETAAKLRDEIAKLKEEK